MHDGRELGSEHATVARIPDAATGPANDTAARTSEGAGKRLDERFPDLHDRLIFAIRTRGYSIRTEQAYASWVRRFVLFSGFRSLAEIQPEKVAPYLEHLAVRRNVSASTQKLALNALVFMFRHVLDIAVDERIEFARAKKPRRLPVVLSRSEISQLLSGIDNPLHHTMASLLYGAGLRLIECVRLRVCDVDFEYRQIVVRNGKGNKDRVVPLLEKLVAAMQLQLDKVRTLHEEDLRAGFGEVHLPHALARKYRNAAKELRWQYLFPSVR